MVATVTDEQSAARELVRGWARTAASGAAATAAVRDMEYGFEEGNADAWRPVFAGLAGLGLFGVAVPEDCGGAGGSIEDLCAMVDEAARALVPGPVATTAVATLVVSDPKLRSALASGERFAGVAIDGGVQVDPKTSTASGTVGRVLGGAPGGVVLLPADGNWLLVDTACDEVVVEPLRATDFSLPLARMVLTSAPVTVLEVSGERVEDLAATVLAAEAAGVARWTLDTAVAYAKVREQFGKPIGSFQAVKHLCAQMLCRAEQVGRRAAEESTSARDALLARDAGARVHICHASAAGTVEILKWAKDQGISITAEVTPHHLLLDDARLASYDGVNRVNPPLREASDAVALRQALADGIIDCVATDHAPHAEHEKCVEFARPGPACSGCRRHCRWWCRQWWRPAC